MASDSFALASSSSTSLMVHDSRYSWNRLFADSSPDGLGNIVGAINGFFIFLKFTAIPLSVSKNLHLVLWGPWICRTPISLTTVRTPWMNDLPLLVQITETAEEYKITLVGDVEAGKSGRYFSYVTFSSAGEVWKSGSMFGYGVFDTSFLGAETIPNLYSMFSCKQGLLGKVIFQKIENFPTARQQRTPRELAVAFQKQFEYKLIKVGDAYVVEAMSYEEALGTSFRTDSVALNNPENAATHLIVSSEMAVIVQVEHEENIIAYICTRLGAGAVWRLLPRVPPTMRYPVEQLSKTILCRIGPVTATGDAATAPEPTDTDAPA